MHVQDDILDVYTSNKTRSPSGKFTLSATSVSLYSAALLTFLCNRASLVIMHEKSLPMLQYHNARGQAGYQAHTFRTDAPPSVREPRNLKLIFGLPTRSRIDSPSDIMMPQKNWMRNRHSIELMVIRTVGGGLRVLDPLENAGGP